MSAAFAAPGILVLDKDAGDEKKNTSAKAAAAAKKLYHANRAGHGGALDPLASGVLAVFFNEATAFSQYALGGDKAYRAKVRFGIATDSDDAQGNIIAAQKKPPPDLAAKLALLLPEFTGEIQQAAPAYSALKHRGKPLYYYARRGEPAPPKIRRVRIDEINIAAVSNGDADLEIVCGGGVYIRALARDLGMRLGCGAHLAALRRTRSGNFFIHKAHRLDALAQLTMQERIKKLLPAEAAVAHLPMLAFSSAPDIRRLAHGQTVACEAADGLYRIRCGGDFAGVVAVAAGGAKAKKMLSSARDAAAQAR
jgi:tRNA pseudouridine55 synthase